MICYDSNFVKCELDSGFYPLRDFFSTINKKVVILTISEYNLISTELLNDNITKFGIECIFLHEWSCVELTTPDDINRVPIPVLIFHYNFDYYNKIKTNYFYYPKWIFFSKDIKKKQTGIDISYPISCACRNFNNGRIGKIYNYQLLKNKSYFHNILFTKYKSIEEFELVWLSELKNSNILNEFLEDYDTWEQLNTEDLDLIKSMGAIDLDVYNKSLFHLVAESAVKDAQLSEKTFKVFLSTQIPIMCGAQHTVKHLRDLGFDMFDDIINHNSYDNIYNWQDRILAMHMVLDNIVELNHVDILQHTQKRRITNSKYLLSDELKSNIIDPIINRLKDML